MMDTARYSAMADPMRNPNFRRAWTGPPPKRKYGPSAPAAFQIVYLNAKDAFTTMNTLQAEEAALVERWAVDKLGVQVVLDGTAVASPVPTAAPAGEAA